MCKLYGIVVGMATTPVTAGIVRVSTDSAEQAQSPENQRDHLARAGATKFYEDRISGSAQGGEKRRQSAVWQQLEADIKARRIGRLLVCEVNRIARRDHLVMALVELCDQYGIEFLATTGGALSAKSAPQWLSVKQQAVFAEFFAREQSDKIRRGQESCRQRGVFGFTSQHLPWHLMKDPDDNRKVIANPERWDDAREAAMDFALARYNSSTICKRLYEKHGILRQSSSLTKWIKSQWLRGHYASRESEEVMIANIAPALVTDAEWELIQKRIKANSKVKGSRAPHKVRPLSGLAHCVKCGRPMTTRTVKDYVYLRCGNNVCDNANKNIRSEIVELEVKTSFGLKRTDFVGEIERQQRVKRKPSKELLNLRTHAQKLKEALVLIDSPGVRADYEHAMARISQLEQAEQPTEPSPFTDGELLDIGSESWWERKSDGELNTVYRLVLDKVWVDAVAKTIEVEWKKSLS